MDWLENAAMRLERPWFLVCSLIKLYATGDVALYDLAEDPGQSAPCSWTCWPTTPTRCAGWEGGST
jgi:hypothetical protein